MKIILFYFLFRYFYKIYTIISTEVIDMEMHLLLVDDATINQALMQKIFNPYFITTGVHTIRDALNYIEDPNYLFDVIILDLVTPGAIDLLRLIKKNERTEKIPVIVIAASNQENDLIEAFDAGAYDYITKPFMSELIINRVYHAGLFYYRYKQLMEEHHSIDESKVNQLTKVFHFDTLKWLVDEKSSHHPHDQRALVIFKIHGLNEIYQNEGTLLGNTIIQKTTVFISSQFSKEDIIGHISEDMIAVYVTHPQSKEALYAKIEDIVRLYNQKKLTEFPDEIILMAGMTYINQAATFENMYQQALQDLK